MIAPRRRARFLLAGLVLVVASTACGSSAQASKPGGKVDVPDSEFVDHTGDADVQVDAVDNLYKDPYITVSPETRVTWKNVGRNPHSVSPVVSGSFKGISTSQFTPGQSHSAIFSTAGDYPYYCSIHGSASLSGQAGVVRVGKH